VTDDLLAMLGIYGGTFVVSIIAGLVPLVNVELFLVAVVRLAVDHASQLPVLVVLAATGQMVAKIGLYHTGRRASWHASRGVVGRPSGRAQRSLEAARERIERWRTKPYAVYAVSSVAGVPPFYLTVLAAGALQLRFRAFLAIGLAGRLLRFAVLVALAWAA